MSQYAVRWPKRSTSITVIAAIAKPAAITNGIATEARSRYLMRRPLTAAFPLLMRPANTAGRLRLPERAKHEAEHGSERQRRHWLVSHRAVDRAFEVAGDLLHAFTCLASLIGDAMRHVFRLTDNLVELNGRLGRERSRTSARIR
jgi:hypothetical protein